jgi:diguanylate cyclase (GGDEF)-like protein
VVAELYDLNMKKNVAKAGRLLHSLVPRAHSFCFYDVRRECGWSSDGAEDSEVDSFIVDLPEEIIARLGEGDQVLRRTLASGRTVLVLPVHGENGQRIGMLVALFSKNAGKSSSFNPGMLKTILEPAIEVIGESLFIGQKLDAAKRKVEEAYTELRFVYKIDERIHGARTHHSSLAELVGRSGRFLGINYSVLLIPSKRIRISATHSTWKSVNRKVLDRYLVEHLLPRLEGLRQPVVFRVPAVKGSDDPAARGYDALLCPLLDSHGNVEGMLAQLGRVDRREFSQRDRKLMANIVRKIEYVIERSFDAMTGFMNRAGFEDQLHQSYKALRDDEDSHQLIYFDLDNLQLVNDTFGREAGDAVIMRFARLLEEGLPKSAAISRLAGDDFCMLLTHADSESAYEYAHRIRENGKKLRYLQGDKSLQVTMSVGIAELNHSTGDDGSALTTARMACEAASDHGRDRIEVYNEHNQSVIRRYDDMQLVAAIQQALDGDEFRLFVQPIERLDGPDDRARFEVLLRMADRDGVRVPSNALFSAAERYCLMPHIDRWVVSSTLTALAGLPGIAEGRAVRFAINLSGQSLGDDEILAFIEDEMRRSGVPASCLCFEVTESAAVSNLTKAQQFLNRLSALGCSIALDDFGAGLSSFAYLKNFNVDILKIDGGFIRDITENRISESMVAAITQVAKVMKLETIAEYVENEKVRDLLKSLGVNYAQGHLSGKPIPLREALRKIPGLRQSSTG